VRKGRKTEVKRTEFSDHPYRLGFSKMLGREGEDLTMAELSEVPCEMLRKSSHLER
jgi:hypothetical protein